MIRTFALVLFVSSCAAFVPSKETMKMRVVPKKEYSEFLHGVEISDPFRYFENSQNEEVIRWTRNEDKYTREYLSSKPGYENIRRRLTELYAVESQSPPIVRGAKSFYTKTAKNQDLPAYYWREIGGKRETELLGPNTLPGYGEYNISSFQPCWNGKIAAYMMHHKGVDVGTIRVIEVETGAHKDTDTIQNQIIGTPKWDHACRGFYYVFDPGGKNMSRPKRVAKCEVRYHKLGTSPSDDRVFMKSTGETDTHMDLKISTGADVLLLNIWHSWVRNELYAMDLRESLPKFRLLRKNNSTRASIDGAGDNIIMLTEENAPKRKILAGKISDQASFPRWKEIVPESTDSLIQSIEIVNNFVVLHRVKNAVSALDVVDFSGKLIASVDLPTLGSVRSLLDSENRDCFHFTFESFAHPTELFEYCISDKKLVSVVRPSITSKISSVILRQQFFRSYDGTKVPMFVVHREDIQPNIDTPTIVYAYGAIGLSLRPYFSELLYLWVEAGGLAAIVNTRGGGEFGSKWQNAGKLCNKQNSIDDFISAAEWLVDWGMTSPQHLGAYGESAGGILVGAAITQRPDLFSAGATDAGMFDMIRYYFTGAASYYAPEFGDPNNPEQFKCLLRYSPYHRVRKGIAYPAVLLSTGDLDDRVHPSHSKKMVAVLRASSTQNSPALLRIQWNVGHYLSSSRAENVSLQTDFATFFASQLGLEFN